MATKNAPFARFWGKIFGTKRDYYIIETDLEIEQQEEIQEPHEPRKEGVNKKVYFVSNDGRRRLFVVIGDEWVELPVLLPRKLVQARRIRHAFTGDLDAVIQTSPVFEGREKDYVGCL